MISEYFITPFIYISECLSLTIYAVSLHPFVILGNVVPPPPPSEDLQLLSDTK